MIRLWTSRLCRTSTPFSLREHEKFLSSPEKPVIILLLFIARPSTPSPGEQMLKLCKFGLYESVTRTTSPSEKVHYRTISSITLRILGQMIGAQPSCIVPYYSFNLLQKSFKTSQNSWRYMPANFA